MFVIKIPATSVKLALTELFHLLNLKRNEGEETGREGREGSRGEGYGKNMNNKDKRI